MLLSIPSSFPEPEMYKKASGLLALILRRPGAALFLVQKPRGRCLLGRSGGHSFSGNTDGDIWLVDVCLGGVSLAGLRQLFCGWG